MKKIVLGVLLTVATLIVGSNVAAAQESGSCYVFNNDLSQGMTFGEALELQKFLASEGSFTAEMNGTFGPLTKAALAQYQSKNGIQATGYFGPATRAHVNARCGQVLGAYDQVVQVPTGTSRTINRTSVSTSTIQTTKPIPVDTNKTIPKYNQGTLTLVTPPSGETWQIGNSHTISWTPNPDSTYVEAFLEVKKGKVFETMAKLIPCAKGSIIWCGAVDTTPHDGIEQASTAKTGQYYLSITDQLTKQTARTRNPIKLVKEGEVVKLKLVANLPKNKRVEATHDTPVTVDSKNITLSWNANAEACDVDIFPHSDSYPDEHILALKRLPRHVTRQTFELPGPYANYRVFVRCNEDSNIQAKSFYVTVKGAVADTPYITKVQAKAAEENELFAGENAWVYGSNLKSDTKVFLDLGNDQRKYFEVTLAQSGSVNILTFKAGELASGTYTLYAENGNKVSNGIRVTYKNPSNEIWLSNPNGGESYNIGDTVDILWNSSGIVRDHNVQIGLVDVRYSSEAGPRPEVLIAPSIPNTGNYTWTIPTNIDTMKLNDTTDPVYKVVIHSWSDVVTGVAIADASDSPFSIIGPADVYLDACQLERDLGPGSTGDDVIRLNLFLESKGFLTIPAGSHASSYQTAAVAAYQSANGISPANGTVGSVTRAYINANCPSFVAVNVEQLDTDVRDGEAHFVFEAEVTALNGDAYLNLSAARASQMSILSAIGFNYQILDANQQVIPSHGVSTSVVNINGKGSPGDNVRIPEGQSISLQVDITYKPVAAGVYYGQLYSVNTSRNSGPVRQQLLLRERSQAQYVSGVTNTLTVTKSGTGSGTVSGLTNGGVYQPGVSVTLTATADIGSKFKGWSGACTGTATTCTVTMDADKTVKAQFDKSTYEGTVTVGKPSGGDGFTAGQTIDAYFTYANVPAQTHVKYSVALVKASNQQVVSTLYTSGNASVRPSNGNITRTVTIPQGTADGQYVMRVTLMNTPGTYLTHDDSDVFTVGDFFVSGPIDVDAVSTDSDAEDGIGTFTFDLDVTAVEDDIFIATTSGSGADNRGFDWRIIGGQAIASITVQSDADIRNGAFVVEEGNTELFTVVVTVDPTTAGSYYVILDDVTYAVGSASNPAQTHVLTPSSEFDTSAVSVTAALGPQPARTARVAADTGSYGPYSAMASLPDLKVGMTHEGVAMIQRFLNAHGFTVNASAGQPGSVGYEANYFGGATQKALAAYQASQGISPAAGTFGPATRAAMASTQN